MRPPSTRTCIAFILMLALVSSLWADIWYNDYQNAEKAIKGKKWDVAVQYLQAALKEKPEPQLNAKTYGLRFIDYLPYFHLGLAYYNSGRFNDAQESFELSLTHGAVKEKSRLKANLEQMLADCLKKLQPKVVPPPVTKKTVSEPIKKEAEPPVKTPGGKPLIKEPVKKETQEAAAEKTVTQTPRKEPEQSGAAPKETTPTPDPLLVEAVQNLNRGIESYFKNGSNQGKDDLVKAAAFFKDKEPYTALLVRAYTFLAVIAIENHYLGGEGSQSGKLTVEARDYIKKIKAIQPGFKLDKQYFSPKVAMFFSQSESKD